ncbi:hypothetical protein [Desulfoluna sp.]|uniref:hypothetical protein n=1 Tax=Desulfoluna sp. TaxID=2045199 RepID=UPI0026137DC0|nr:hypothetical protein [Desulfoluna sp.]
MIEEIQEAAEERPQRIDRIVFTGMHSGPSRRHPGLLRACSAMAKHIVSTHYSGISRYTTCTVLKIKLGEALSEGDAAPHSCETGVEAVNVLLE